MLKHITKHHAVACILTRVCVYDLCAQRPPFLKSVGHVIVFCRAMSPKREAQPFEIFARPECAVLIPLPKLLQISFIHQHRKKTGREQNREYYSFRLRYLLRENPSTYVFSVVPRYLALVQKCCKQ